MTTIQNDEVAIDLDNFDKWDEIAKFEDIKAVGWSIIVRLYVEKSNHKSNLYVPSSVIDNQKYINCTGLVVKVAKNVYMDKRYDQTGVWCDIGDWVVFPRHGGYRIVYKGMPVFILKEDAIDAIVTNPKLITRD